MGKRKRKSEEWRAKRERENKFLHDLSGFPNLRQLYEAEALLSARKKAKRRKKKHTHNNNDNDNHNNVNNNCQADLRGEIGVNNVVEVKTTKALVSGDRIDFAVVTDVSSYDDVVQNNGLVEIVLAESFPGKSDVKTRNVDCTGKKENVVEMSETLALNDRFKIPMDLTLASSERKENVMNSSLGVYTTQSLPAEDDGDIKNRSFGRSAAGEQLGPNEIRKKRRQSKRRKKRNVCANIGKHAYGNEKQVCGNEINGAGASKIKSNAVLCQLLRRPRYFDFTNYWDTCSFCGEEHHVVDPCVILKQKQNKPCFYCGSYRHSWRSCTQGQFCYACKSFGHVVDCCPEKHQEHSSIPDVCLRCGNPGHDMMSCKSEYCPDDLKKMQCYVCKNFGHLCCYNYPDAGSSELSCYNCGFSGHLGLPNWNCTSDDGKPLRDFKPFLREEALK